MTITRLHLSITVLLALALHGGLAIWLALPTPAPTPTAPPLRINLLAMVADSTVNAAVAPTKPLPEPISEPSVEPHVEPEPVEKPIPVPPTSRPVNHVPEPILEPIQEKIQPTASSEIPLDTIATARYEQLLVAWLEKHKKYPRRAKRLRIEGEGRLRILIDRTGRTLQVTLEERTGNRLLDKATLEMARRADPFPPIPENDPRRQMEFIVPVAFVLH